jgi:hypothetical protein
MVSVWLSNFFSPKGVLLLQLLLMLSYRLLSLPRGHWLVLAVMFNDGSYLKFCKRFGYSFYMWGEMCVVRNRNWGFSWQSHGCSYRRAIAWLMQMRGLSPFELHARWDFVGGLICWATPFVCTWNRQLLLLFDTQEQLHQDLPGGTMERGRGWVHS